MRKTYMVTMDCSVKAFDKAQHPFMLETLIKLVREGHYLNPVKNI